MRIINRALSVLVVLFSVFLSDYSIAQWNFEAGECPTQTCDVNGNCTEVNRCVYVDSKAAHCQVQLQQGTQSCSEIQSRNLLSGENGCESLGNGTVATPYCALSTAAEQSLPGDLVYIAPARYLVPQGTNGLSNFNTQATAQQPIVFQNAAFEPSAPSIPNADVLITSHVEVDGWRTLSDTGSDLICAHSGLSGDSTSFNGITTNIQGINSERPMLKLYSEGCGVATESAAVEALTTLNSVESLRQNQQGHYVQVWGEGNYSNSTCPATKGAGENSTVVKVAKSEAVTSCDDLNLSVTGTGYTVLLPSSRDVCGDLEQVLENKGISGVQYADNEADHIHFVGLTIEGANYGFTVETDNVILAYSTVAGSYKDAIKAIGPEPWDLRQPNQCARVDDQPSNAAIQPALADLVSFCKGENVGFNVGSQVQPPQCNGDVLNTDNLDSQYFYWSLPESEGRQHMAAARDTDDATYCVDGECVYQPKQALKKYCRETAPIFDVDAQGVNTPVPDNCRDYYYFNAQNVTIHGNHIRYFGEEGIDITGGDNWTVTNNTIYDSVITHGAGQLPAGVLSKNVSDNNTISDNLFFNINHTLTGIISLGGAPAKAKGATNLTATNNALLSVSGERIFHIPGCENCLLANNLVLDAIIGEEGSRSRGMLHVGGHRKQCYGSDGSARDCGSELRDEAYAGENNSVVNNVMDGFKWRDKESYRVLSFGGVKENQERDYRYNGDQGLCVTANAINPTRSLPGELSHVSSDEVPNLACGLSSVAEVRTLDYNHPRVQECMAEVRLESVQYEEANLVACLTSDNENRAGNALVLNAQAVLPELSLTSQSQLSVPVGACSDNGAACSVDSQCGVAKCEFTLEQLDDCVLGLKGVGSPVNSGCASAFADIMLPVSTTELAYPTFKWAVQDGDSEYRFLLHRFVPATETQSHSYELISYEIFDKSSACDQSGLCTYRAPYLLTDATYTWKIRRKQNDAWLGWVDTMVFYVSDPERIGHFAAEATKNLTPIASQTIYEQPTLSWQHDPYSQNYSILFYRYENGYNLLANTTLTAQEIDCTFEGNCNIGIGDLLQKVGSGETNIEPGTYTWKIKKWTNGTASSWSPTSVFFLK